MRLVRSLPIRVPRLLGWVEYGNRIISWLQESRSTHIQAIVSAFHLITSKLSSLNVVCEWRIASYLDGPATDLVLSPMASPRACWSPALLLTSSSESDSSVSLSPTRFSTRSPVPSIGSEECPLRVGPHIASKTGKNTRPCVTPRTIMAKKQMKTVCKIWLVLSASGRTPRDVDIPPTRIDAPIVSNVSLTLFSLVFSLDS